MSQSFDQDMQVAVSAHRKGDLVHARGLYESLIERFPERVDVQHNLGLVCLLTGFVAKGAHLMATAIEADPDNAGMQNSPKLLGMELYRHMYWEQALPWLKRAIQQDPNDAELHQTVARISDRAYLAPEAFDPLAGRTLKRYSPREASDYIYTIDIAGTCNLRCPSCPVGNSVDSLRVNTMMKMTLFKQIIQKISAETPSPSAQIRLYNWGEPLLHPRLAEILELIHNAGFTSHLSSNLNIKPAYLEKMVAANPTELKVSLSGFTQSSYSQTHTKGDIALVIDNLRAMRTWLDQYESSTHVWVNFHRYKSNLEDEAPMRDLCAELGFGFYPIDAFYQPLDKLIALAEGDESVLKEPVVEQLLNAPAEHLKYLKAHQLSDYDCELRFNQMVINADGSVAQCCALYDSSSMPSIAFLEHQHVDIERAKYTNPVCKRCTKLGLNFAPKSLPNAGET